MTRRKPRMDRMPLLQRLCPKPRVRQHPIFGQGYVWIPTTAALKYALRYKVAFEKKERQQIYAWLVYRRTQGMHSHNG